MHFGELWWLSPMVLLTVMATAGPFIYLAIQRRAEEKLFQDQRRYQSTLRQASTGMGRIKDMDKLLDMIVRVVTRSVRIEHSFIYLSDRKSKEYKLEASRFRNERTDVPQTIASDSRVLKALKKIRAPIVFSEVQQRAQDFKDLKLQELEEQMSALHAELIVPCFIDEKLIAVMVMGKKVSGELYSQDDLAVFMILSNQAGLAIENAQFYKDMRATHEQLFRAEKMATIGIMADGLSHQINNRLHALGFIAGDALDTIQLNKKLKMTDEVKEMMVDIEHALTRIQENVSQGGEVVRGLLKYSRKSDEQFGEVELDELIDEAVTMAQFKIKTGEMSIVRDFEPGLPKIHGNFTQLQEVFFNMIDNAYDAMMQRKSDLKEEGYEPRITIKAERSRMGSMRIVLEDNGIGIRAEDQEKIFTPFFTTKLSSKKGTGLGLYVIQKLIEENHKGKVFYKSEYGKGTRVYITLPTVEGLDQDMIQSVERQA
ncbi:MAG TPA: ATP-binding protein [Candidatus Omnitrophota bacterium]|nr:ATP-binding protein [Candidatus Omnitrophota bacterium]